MYILHTAKSGVNAFFQAFSTLLKHNEPPVSLLREQLNKFTKNVKSRYKISEKNENKIDG